MPMSLMTDRRRRKFPSEPKKSRANINLSLSLTPSTPFSVRYSFYFLINGLPSAHGLHFALLIQLSMPFSATPPASSAQAHLGTRDRPMNLGSEYVMQSRETGEVVPPPSGKSIRRTDKPEPKPFAHFIAGGYVKPDSRFQSSLTY